MNTCEPVIKIVILNTPKRLTGVSQNGTGRGYVVSLMRHRRSCLPGREQAPNPSDFRKRNVETPYSSQRVAGKVNRKGSRWECGLERSEEAKVIL